jgi:hypothetical protein
MSGECLLHPKRIGVRFHHKFAEGNATRSIVEDTMEIPLPYAREMAANRDKWKEFVSSRIASV